jgi:hypothetical protein
MIAMPRTLAIVACILSVTLSACVLSCESCRAPKRNARDGAEGELIRGWVRIYGNEPFTHAGIELEDGKTVYAVYPREAELRVWDLQGRLLEFTVERPDEASVKGLVERHDGVVTPLSWKETP